jgi:hypothetical protein
MLNNKRLPPQLQQVIAPDFGTTPPHSNAAEEEELEQQTRQVRWVAMVILIARVVFLSRSFGWLVCSWMII